MSRPRLLVVRHSLSRPVAASDEEVVLDDEVRGWVASGRVVSRLLRYRDSRLLTERLGTAGRPMILWALWAMARGGCSIADTEGQQRDVTIALLLRWSRHLIAEAFGKAGLLRSVARQVAVLEQSAATTALPRELDRTGSPLYLRTDLSFGVRAGGSVGHIAGVLNALRSVFARPILVTTADVPTLDPEIEVHRVSVPEAFWNFQELPAMVLNDAVHAEALRALNGRRPSLVYQRYSLNSYAGLRLARTLRVPFVVEYNGSEIWMGRHWGRPLRYETLAARIEMLNVNAADLVVVVSEAMRDELVSRGASSERILVNPNAVDAARYNAGVDGGPVRMQFGLDGKTVIGFVATFQPWHGSEELAEAFVETLRRRPEYRSTVRLLMIGEGPRLARTRAIIAAAGLEDITHFTGLVPQPDGAKYLAACDILASPHVPNPDGSPFFGSPTKLFEYMAMGKAIVASRLDQIGAVLRHGATGWLVEAGDVGALADGMARLVDDPPLRNALGTAAARDASSVHTWPLHVQRMVDALESRLHASPA